MVPGKRLCWVLLVLRFLVGCGMLRCGHYSCSHPGVRAGPECVAELERSLAVWGSESLLLLPCECTNVVAVPCFDITRASSHDHMPSRPSASSVDSRKLSVWEEGQAIHAAKVRVSDRFVHAATTVTLSDALLPMPPGDTGTESLELQAGMPRAAGTTPLAWGAVAPGAFRGGDILDVGGAADSGGAAQLLPHLPSPILSDCPSAGEQAVSAASPAASDAPAAPRADPTHSRGEAPASSGSTPSARTRGGRGDQRSQWRAVRSLLVAHDRAQGGGLQGGRGQSVAGQGGTGVAAGDGAGENVLDGVMRVSGAAGVGGGSVSRADAKPGEGTVAAQGKGSWMGMWVCCGKKKGTIDS